MSLPTKYKLQINPYNFQTRAVFCRFLVTAKIKRVIFRPIRAIEEARAA